MAKKPPDDGHGVTLSQPLKQYGAIKAHDIKLTFQTSDGLGHALTDVNLSIGNGDFVSFIGPLGCGKTTLLRVIAALETPTAGEITVNGMTPGESRTSQTELKT